MGERKGIAVLGATGSVGSSALDVIARFPARFRVTALCAGGNAKLLGELARRFRPSLVCLAEESSAKGLGRLPRGTGVAFGEQGMTEAVCAPEAGIVLAAAAGVSSIRPVIAAAARGKRIALANKELLVMAGKFLYKAAKRGGAEILPVDSEHSAVFQAISGHRHEDIRRIILTASGGPFRNHTLRRMRKATVSEALGHPTWRMGTKISVDSATLMNKGLEVIEATWLFGLPPSRIDVLIHPQSVVHSVVEYRDGSMIAQLGILGQLCGMRRIGRLVCSGKLLAEIRFNHLRGIKLRAQPVDVLAQFGVLGLLHGPSRGGVLLRSSQFVAQAGFNCSGAIELVAQFVDLVVQLGMLALRLGYGRIVFVLRGR
jgi:1-deoxy-D-xylulose 5-phosphate reductoisomerase